jgi:Ca2+-binding EF-hand superfamily protein
MKEYARHLIRLFDNNSDGIINFQELCQGLSRLNIVITN